MGSHQSLGLSLSVQLGEQQRRVACAHARDAPHALVLRNMKELGGWRQPRSQRRAARAVIVLLDQRRKPADNQ